MAYITFDDGNGEVRVRSCWPSPADRLGNWMPANFRPHGDRAPTIATELTVMLITRRDYGASFEMRGIPMGDEVGGALDLAARLVAHLLNGGVCSVFTEDALASSYDNCCLAPGSTPSLQQADRRTLEYTLALALRYLDGSTSDPMICHYA